MVYVEKIGKTHLADNDFRSNKKYDEMDVVNFNMNDFLDKLQRPLDETIMQPEPEVKEEPFVTNRSKSRQT